MIGDEYNPGLIPRSIKKLFLVKQQIENKEDVSVYMSVELIEIHNEKIHDLLGPEGQLVKLQQNFNEAVNNVRVYVRDEKEVHDAMDRVEKRRCAKGTKGNAESSRSHLVLFTIHFEVVPSGDGPNGLDVCIEWIQQGVNGSPKVAAMERKFPSFPHTVFVKYIEPDISSFLTFNQEADRSQGHQLLAYNTFSCDPKTSGQGCSYSIPR